MKKPITLLLTLITFLVRAQGTFQNLGFETGTIVPIPGDVYDRVQFGSAFPGWSGYLGGVPQNKALYNSAFLDTSGIGILDSGANTAPNPLVHGRLIQGSYTALLMAGFGGDATLSQTALIPLNVMTLFFNVSTYNPTPGTFGVTIGGQSLALTPISTLANSTLYGADIHGWAGQTNELAFTVFAEVPHVSNRYLFLDSIQFSTQPIPEPSALGLIGLGALLFSHRTGWRRKKS